MTTTTTYNLADGSEVTLKTNPGAAPLVFLNGVIQQPGTYSLSGTNVIFDTPQFGKKWKPWYAWHPVRINGRWYWLTQVYRRRKGALFKRYDSWIYGDDFDALKDIK